MRSYYKDIYHMKIFTFMLFSACHFNVFAQDNILLKEKPGTFKITNGTLNGQGPDQYMKSCDFTDVEATVARNNLIALVGIFRRNPVLKDIRGFDGYCYLNGGRCNTKFGYGLPSTPCFFFETWTMRKGKEIKQTIEPPQWRFEVNMTEKFCSNGFNVTNYSDAYNPTNPAFSEDAMDKATFALREIFYLPGIREEVSPGIDRYDEQIVIFNPDRPVYWEQITIREVFRLMMDYWKLIPNKITNEAMMPVLEREFSKFSETEKNGFAYFGNPGSISRIGSAVNETPVMRPNPEYWNRKLPRSAIQFMVLEIPLKKVVKSKMDDRLKRQDGYYYVSRLLYELDVKDLLTAIEY
jgi:hypothetical protein